MPDIVGELSPHHDPDNLPFESIDLSSSQDTLDDLDDSRPRRNAPRLHLDINNLGGHITNV